MEVGAVDGQRAFGLADRVAARQELGSHGRLVGPRPRRRTLDPRTELTPSHYRELGVEPVVFVTPLRQLPVPLVPPPLPYTRRSGNSQCHLSHHRYHTYVAVATPSATCPTTATTHTSQWQLPVPLVPPPLPYTRRSCRVVSGVSGPRFESRRGLSCLSRQLLRYAALGTGCAVPRTTQLRCYFYVRSKADMDQLNLPHGTNN